MAQEIVNRMFAGVKCAGDGTIVARTAAIASVLRLGAGIYTLTLNEGIAGTEAAYGQSLGISSGGSMTATRLSNTQFDVRTYQAGGAADREWNFVIHRINSQNGA